MELLRLGTEKLGGLSGTTLVWITLRPRKRRTRPASARASSRRRARWAPEAACSPPSTSRRHRRYRRRSRAEAGPQLRCRRGISPRSHPSSAAASGHFRRRRRIGSGGESELASELADRGRAVGGEGGQQLTVGAEVARHEFVLPSLELDAVSPGRVADELEAEAELVRPEEGRLLGQGLEAEDPFERRRSPRTQPPSSGRRCRRRRRRRRSEARARTASAREQGRSRLRRARCRSRPLVHPRGSPSSGRPGASGTLPHRRRGAGRRRAGGTGGRATGRSPGRVCVNGARPPTIMVTVTPSSIAVDATSVATKPPPTVTRCVPGTSSSRRASASLAVRRT